MTIIQGATVEIDNAGATDFNAIGDISDTQQVVFYNASNAELAARVLDITLGTRTIDTVNAEQSLITQAFHFNSITAAQLTASKYLIAQTGSGAVSKARIGVANVSGTTVTYASAGELTPTDDDLQFIRGSEIIGLTTTTALWVYVEPVTASSTFARVISVDGSDNVSEGARTELSDDENDPWCVIVFSTTKALFVYQDVSDSDKLKGRIITISGTTVTAEAVVLIDDNRTWDLFYWSMARVSSTKAAFLAQDNGGSTLVYGFVLTFNGTTSFTAGSEQGNFPVGVQNSSAASTNDQRFLWTSRSGTTQTVYEFEVNVSLNTLSHTPGNDVDILGVANSSVVFPRLYTIATNHAITLTYASIDGTIVETTAAASATPGELTSAPMFKPCSIDADGNFIYIGGINSLGFPTLLKFATALNADATAVFAPGAGDNIGVQCGKYDSEIVWVAGNFGGTDTVEQSEDGGASFTVKDNGSFDPVTSFVVGPDSDNRVLIFTDAGGSVPSTSIHETDDNGDSWEERNSALSLISKAVARLDINVEELVTGNEASATDNVDYSVNSGADLEDYSSGFPMIDVTGVEVG